MRENLARRAAALGRKHQCTGCGTRFYDLCRVPPACPKCGVEARDEPVRYEAFVPEPDDDDRRARMTAGLQEEDLDAAGDDDDAGLDEVMQLLGEGGGDSDGEEAGAEDGDVVVTER